ncbi:unannotated protein [freshwater metagenome]|uniref:Unannotated protein n=1 Tax=freshwater metagenome TaxID=449393 RepID=A0A6J6DWS3_9ZZZZ
MRIASSSFVILGDGIDAGVWVPSILALSASGGFYRVSIVGFSPRALTITG